MPYSAEQYRNAIAGIESGGSNPYAAVGDAGRGADKPLGRYQVMTSNLNPWLRQYLGKVGVTPEMFLQDQGLQDQLFDAVFGSYVKEHGERGAASKWFTGSPDEPNRSDVHGKLTGKSYTDRFMRSLGAPFDPRSDTPSSGKPTSDQFALPKVDTAYGGPGEGAGHFGGSGLGTPIEVAAKDESGPWAGGEMPPIPPLQPYSLPPVPAATVAKGQAAPMVNQEQQQARRQQLAALLAQLNAPLQQRQA